MMDTKNVKLITWLHLRFQPQIRVCKTVFYLNSPIYSVRCALKVALACCKPYTALTIMADLQESTPKSGPPTVHIFFLLEANICSFKASALCPLSYVMPP